VPAAAAPVLKGVRGADYVGAAAQCGMQGDLAHASAVAVCAAGLQTLQARGKQKAALDVCKKRVVVLSSGFSMTAGKGSSGQCRGGAQPRGAGVGAMRQGQAG
jgi:hypothetical protein